MGLISDDPLVRLIIIHLRENPNRSVCLKLEGAAQRAAPSCALG
jgi:hypothetical protein